MDLIELASLIESNRSNALGYEDSELSNQRAEALDRYFARPYGDEKDNRSAVVSNDLAETVDWIMPAIMRVFVQSGNIAEFVANSAAEEAMVKEESNYVNQVIMEDNNGFINLHDAVKDALILKNGYFKHYWLETDEIDEQEYKGLSSDQMTTLIMDLQSKGEVEIIGHDQAEIMTPIGPIVTHDIKLKVTTKYSRCVVEAVPCEEMRVSKSCRGSLQESPFTEHVTIKTRSELLEMGMDREFVNELKTVSQSNETNSQEVNARDSINENTNHTNYSNSDKSMDEIEYCEAYLKVDYDGDGIAELRKVVMVGGRIPEGDEWNERIDAVPCTGIVMKRVPHRHVGESLHDELEDLTRQKTVLTRQLLDNAYLTNNAEWMVNQRVHLKDFMQSTPGGLKRISGMEPVDGAASPVIVPSIIGQILPVLDYIDQVKGNRTGIDRTSTGLDPDTLRQATKGAFLENLNKASQKVEMIIRMLAESGIKDLVLQVHAILKKHNKEAVPYKENGQYKQIQPSSWPKRRGAKVRVGIGTGNEQEKQQKLSLLSALQDKLASQGLISPINSYNLFVDTAKVLGFDIPEKYAMNPASPEFKQMMEQRNSQNQPNPLAEAEQVKGRYKLQSDQMLAQMRSQMAQMSESNKTQLEQIKAAHKQEMDVLKLRIETNQQEADRRSREVIEGAKLEVEAMLKGVKIDIGQPGIGTGMA